MGHTTNSPLENLFSNTRIESSGNQDDATSKNTTGFNAEAAQVATQIANRLTIDDSYTSTPDAGEDSSIITFLEKPRILHSSSFTINDTVSTFPEWVVPRDLLDNDLCKRKLANIYSFKADIKLRITVNATPFQQGRYMLVWIPTGGSSNQGNVSSAWKTQHAYSLVQRSQLPRVEIDLACDTEATLIIPHVSCMSHTLVSTIGTTRTISNLGYVQIYPYSALTVPEGSSTAGYTVWSSLQNITLSGIVISQSGIESQMTPIDREQRAGNIGPISKKLTQISSTANILSGVPLLSSFSSPVAWAANLASKVANVYGWSRPTVISPIQRMKQEPFGYLKNADQPDLSAPISMKADNQVELLPGFSGTDVDEMSIDFIKKIPSWYDTVTWTTAQTAGAYLFTCPMRPGFFYRDSVSGFSKLESHTPLSMLSRYFTFWRGSITFKIKLVKTGFHSGRIAFVFDPNEAIVNTPNVLPTLSNSQGTYREVLDIRESSEITLTIPYLQAAPWLSTDSARDDSTFGELYCIVIDPLVAPTMVTPSIRFLIEVCGGDDMEFAVPKTYNYSMALPISSQMGDPCETVNTMIGGTLSKSKTDAFTRSCIGEDINSLRFMMKNPTPYFHKTNVVTDKYTIILPYSWSAAVSSGASPTVDSTCGRCFYDMCSGMYALSRGGVRIKGYQRAISGTQSSSYENIPVISTLGQVLQSTFPRYPMETSATALVNDGFIGSFGPMVFQMPRYTGGIDVQVPQYHKFHSRASPDHFTWSGHQQEWTSNTANQMYLQIESQTGSAYSFWKCGADDANFGCFVSIPPVWTGDSV